MPHRKSPLMYPSPLRPSPRLAVILLATWLCACSESNDDTQATHTTLVDTALTQTQDLPLSLQSTGRLESRAAPLVAAEIDGRVLRLAVDEGDVCVHAGQQQGLIHQTICPIWKIGRYSANTTAPISRPSSTTVAGSISPEP